MTKFFRKWWSIIQMNWKIRKLKKRVKVLYDMGGVTKFYPDWSRPDFNAKIVDLK